MAEPEDANTVPVEVPKPEFTGEEGWGRFLDLHALHTRFINAKFGRRVEYPEFVQEAAWGCAAAPRSLRSTRAYRWVLHSGRAASGSATPMPTTTSPHGPCREYLSDLVEYLEGFYRRSNPLGSLDKVYKKTLAEFESQWAAGQVPGWEDRGTAGAEASTSAAAAVVDLAAFSSAEVSLTSPACPARALADVSYSCITGAGGSGRGQAQGGAEHPGPQGRGDGAGEGRASLGNQGPEARGAGPAPLCQGGGSPGAGRGWGGCGIGGCPATHRLLLLVLHHCIIPCCLVCWLVGAGCQVGGPDGGEAGPAGR